MTIFAHQLPRHLLQLFVLAPCVLTLGCGIRVGEVPGVKSTDVEIVLDPPWSRDKMTDSAKLELGIF